MSNNQFGFREGADCEIAIKTLVDLVSDYRVKTHVGVMFLDIKSAFDNLDWGLLADRFEEIGVPDFFGNFVKSYLVDRTVTFLGNDFEITRRLGKGCPQGSVVAPHLWNIYINDIVNLENYNCKIIAYADALAVVARGLRRRDLEENMNNFCNIVYNRLKDLIVSPTKTKCLAFQACNPSIGRSGYNYFKRSPIFKIDGKSVKVVKSCNYLGVTSDARLGWSEHVSGLFDRAASLSHAFGRMAGASWGVEAFLQKFWYKSVVLPAITYGAGVWGGKFD